MFFQFDSHCLLSQSNRIIETINGMIYFEYFNKG